MFVFVFHLMCLRFVRDLSCAVVWVGVLVFICCSCECVRVCVCFTVFGCCVCEFLCRDVYACVCVLFNVALFSVFALFACDSQCDVVWSVICV